MGRYLLLDTYGMSLGIKNGRFVVRKKENGRWVVLADLSPPEIDSVVIASEGVSLSSAALMEAARHGIDVVFIDWKEPIARIVSSTYGSSVWDWVNQLEQSNDSSRRGELAGSIVYGKVRNQGYVLRLFRKSEESSGRRRPDLRRAYDDLMNHSNNALRCKDWRKAAEIEASAARIYWDSVKTLLPKQLGFSRRLKKWSLPPGQEPDPFNIALNIGYSILAKEVWRAIFMVGLNPYVGFLHERRPGRMSLVYDLMEEFRPIAVDKPLIKLARSNPSVIKALQARRKNREVVRRIWKVVVENLRTSKPPLQEIIRSQARKFKKAIMSKGSYVPYLHRV